MLRIFCKTLLTTRAKDSVSIHVRFLQTISSTDSISGAVGSINQQNLTISYLMNSCGLPIEAAASMAQKIHIETTDRPDSVIELLRSNGFTNPHIANLITNRPRLLLSDPVKTLKPKIDFFLSLGFSISELATFLSSDQTILTRSLQKQIIPTLNFLKTFIHTNENLIRALKQCSSVVGRNIRSVLEPNVATLRSYGVPDLNISRMIILRPQPLTLSVSRFKDVVAAVKNMGFDPSNFSFILAIFSTSVLRKQSWESKKEALKSFGWSDDEFHLAFKLQPMVMLSSEKKLRHLMDFYVNKLHLKPSAIARCPNLFLVSFERRIIPRCSVLQVLMSKGLIDKDVKLVSVLIANKQSFEKRFVTRYEGQAPEVIRAFKGEMRFIGFDG